MSEKVANFGAFWHMGEFSAQMGRDSATRGRKTQRPNRVIGFGGLRYHPKEFMCL